MDEKILEQLEQLNKSVNDVLLFLLCREGYSRDQIRAVLGAVNNDRVAKVRAGLSAKKGIK